MTRTLQLNAAATIVGITALGLACPAPILAQANARPADVNRGAVIAAQGTVAGVAACAQCHAFNGSSDGSGAFPRIAGQSAYYLEKQMKDFASGVRANAVMTPISKVLSPEDIADVAAYYAGANGPFLPLKSADPALVKRGKQLASIGDAAKGLQSCNNCHGPGGVGLPPAIPYLAGQYAQYTASQLKMWQRGFRKSSLEAMALVASHLDDGDIAAVAAYYQQLRGSPDATAQKE
jgi:cytochrome c553